MRITLVHNASAGDGKPSALELTRALSKAGHSINYVSSKEAELDRALATAADLVAVAGGDGTVEKVATQINSACPIAILPTGNANNIAKSLGTYGAVDELISSWTAARVRPFHLIAARGFWGNRRIVEGVGLGAITCALEKMSGNKPSIGSAREIIDRILETVVPLQLDINLDGKSITGRFPILEVTKIALVGPNLLLAPDADPSNEDLTMCILGDKEGQQQKFSKWLADATQSDVPAPVSVVSCRHLTINGRFQKIRLNDDICSDTGAYDQEISLEPEAQPVHFLVPAK